MSAYTTNEHPAPITDRIVFVSEYVEINAIDKCLQDNRVTFVPVDSATFDAQAQHKLHKRFLFLERDHFSACIRGEAPIKCHYQTRNAVMSEYWLGRIQRVTANLKQIDGLWCSMRPSIHYFVHPDSVDSLKSNCSSHYNTVTQYVEEDDLTAFAETVKSKPFCDQRFFVINQGEKYMLVDVNSTAQTFEYSRLNTRTMQFKLWKHETTVQSLIDEEAHIAQYRPDPKRYPGFKLRDSDGKEVLDGEQFMLEIISIYHDPESYTDDEGYDELSEDEKRLYGKELINIFDVEDDNQSAFANGAMHNGTVFHAEIVDNIVYLKHGRRYLNTHLDPAEDYLTSDVVVPAKNNRIQIHYAEDGNMHISAWGGRTYAIHEWMGDGCGMISLSLEELYLDSYSPMKLRIVRL